MLYVYFFGDYMHEPHKLESYIQMIHDSYVHMM